MAEEIRLGKAEYLWLEKGLKGIGVFADLRLKSLATILPYMRLNAYPKAWVLCREGDLGDMFYLLYKGKVDIIKDTGIFKDRPTRIATLRPGQCFGEMSLLFNVPRTATCAAVADSQIFTLSQRDFAEVIRSHKGMLGHLQKIATQRLKRLGN